MFTNEAFTALKHVPTEPIEVLTPTGSKYFGVRQVTPVCGVSILRAGASMENALRNVYTYAITPAGCIVAIFNSCSMQWSPQLRQDPHPTK